MNRTGLPQLIIEGIGLILLQALILHRLNLSLGDMVGLPVQLMLYPFIILGLPLRTHWLTVMLLSFGIGLSIDLFAGTPGLHAGASVFSGYTRRLILRMTEPGEGYNTSMLPVSAQLFGRWSVRYVGWMMAAHLFFYYCLEAFTFAYFGRIMLSSLLTFAISAPVVYMLFRLLRAR